MKLYSKLALATGLSISLLACVPQRKFEDLKGKYDTCQEESSGLKRANQGLESTNTELNARLNEVIKDMDFLKRDTTVLGTSLRQLTRNYDQLNKTYRELLSLQEKIQQGNATEIQKMQVKISETQSDLMKQEDELKDLARELETKSANLSQAQSELNATLSELEAREKRVKELEAILQRKDSIVNALKDKVTSALYGFEEDGLTVQLKNGKVYVSLENQLLFKSGSYTVDEKGKAAIKKLAKVLGKNEEISVLVEGHTDTDAYNGSGALKDNWDLSVIRSTQIVKLLIELGKLDPSRVTAAGRGQFTPLVEGTDEASKRKNRRIEIILSPKLDELFEILNAN